MPRAQDVARSILAYNRGRAPQQVQRKFELLRRDPFTFFRGTCRLFYATLPRAALFSRAPAVLACGDLHLENFGTFKGDNRLVYFDFNDFDEAALAPCTLELVRFLASVQVAAEHLGLSKRQAARLCCIFLETYRRWIGDGKARWIERSTSEGMVRELLRSLKRRTRRELLDRRTERTKTGRRLHLDDEHTLPIAMADRRRIKDALRRVAAAGANPSFFHLLDAGRRVAGNGSLGLERYVLLVEGRGAPDNHYLLDLKFAAPSALAPAVKARQPAWASEAHRVVATQRIVQAISPALLHAVVSDGKSYVLKELQPTADRLDLALWHGRFERLESVIVTMAEVTAWGELRGSGRHGAAGVEDLQRFVAGKSWAGELLHAADDCRARTLEQWRAYCEAYDGGLLGAAK